MSRRAASTWPRPVQISFVDKIVELRRNEVVITDGIKEHNREGDLENLDVAELLDRAIEYATT